MNTLVLIASLVRRRFAVRRARRTYRALCDDGRAPIVHVDIHLDLGRGDDWSTMTGHHIGVTGYRSEIPLTPEGERHIAAIVAGIRRECVAQILRDQEQERLRRRLR